MKVMKVKDKVFSGLGYIDPTGAIDGLMTYKNQKEHPLMIFGAGVYQFFHLLETLLVIFFVMSMMGYY